MASAEIETTPELAVPARPPKGSARRRRLPVWPVLAAACLLFAWWSWGWVREAFSGGGVDPSSLQVYIAKRGPLVVTVTEDGNVQSASNVELKCQVEGGSQILSIIPEGTQVTRGTELVRLDSAPIEEQITQQKIQYETARSADIEQEENFAVATIAVKEYVEGTYLQELQTADANIVIARENLKSAQNILEHSEKMFRKGYINQLQLETSRFAVQRAQLDLDTYLTARKVLAEYTREKREKELVSAREAAHAGMMAKKAATELEKSKLDRLTEQLKRCVIIAPQDGMVIYANDSNRWGNQQTLIEEGATVREFQTIIKLPDLSRMEVKALVHESKVEMIKEGMTADVRIRDRQMKGKVVSVASQPEQTSFFSAQVKEYATIVNIDDAAEALLKPGMTAEVEILISRLDDVISVPLLGVVELGGETYCFLKTGKADPWYEKRRVVAGINNDSFIEIKDGLAAGDAVILNPRATIEEARRDSEQKAAPDKSTEAGAENGSKDERKSGDGARPGPDPATPEKGKEKSKEKAKRGSFDLAAMDANKDGKITTEEMPERMRAMFPMIDENKDGFLDKKEIAAIRAKMRQRAAGEGPAGPPTD